jgi:hypothetical protein
MEAILNHEVLGTPGFLSEYAESTRARNSAWYIHLGYSGVVQMGDGFAMRWFSPGIEGGGRSWDK